MSSISHLQQSFTDYFSSLIPMWGTLRQSKDPSQLSAFTVLLTKWIAWASQEELGKLADLLNQIKHKLSQDETLTNDIIGHIDLVLNELIAASKATQNKYLVRDITKSAFSATLPQLNVAIIDDSEIARISTKAMLDRFNFVVTCYESISDFETNPEALPNTHVVLLDVIMPDITEDDLFSFAKRLRNRGINIILVSGVDEFDIRLKAVRADISGYVTKPFDINLLVSNIRWMCNLDIEKPYQVLLLDDQPSVGKYLDSFAKKNDIKLKLYDNSFALFDDLEMSVPDLFLLDINMPDITGIEVCKILRQQQRFEYVPIVFLSADDRLETKLEALSAGGDDLIIKNNPPEIIFKQIERRIIRGQQIRTMAVKDSLTGLLNHGQMMDAAASALRLAQRNNTEVAVAMIDIDNFKKVNDNRGHMNGDNVIVGLAQLLKTSVRESDVVGRYGGEEFVVIFHSDDIQAIELKMNNIKTTFSKLLFKDGQESFSCTFSCGIASSSHANSLKEIINLADQMMYDVKRNGKNGVKVA